MKRFRHILVVVALLLATLPCVHAGSHDSHEHDLDSAAELCATHTCACHSCDAEAPCAEDLVIPQDRIQSGAAVAQPRTTPILFVLTPEAKPLAHRAPPAIAGPLVALRTIRLLI